jgi:tetratricopeptide (TPR) repeat protein
MNFINIIIIGGTLFALIIVIMIITKSLKNVDEKIVEELKSKDNKERRKFFSRVRGWAMSFFELIIKKTKKNIQNLHSWIIKEKKKNKSDIIKAKDELIIEKDDVGAVDYNLKEDEVQENFIQNEAVAKKLPKIRQEKIKNDDERNEDISVFYNKKKEAPVDSLAIEKNDKNNTEKKGFMKSLFKKNKQNKKIVDIHNGSLDKWTLGGENISINSENQTDDGIEIAEVGRKFIKNTEKSGGENKIEPIVIAGDNDEMIGVDRKILERKILQKIDKNPKELNNYRELGDLYIKMEKLDDALEVFGYVLSVNPRDLVALRKKRKIKLLKRITK